MTDTTPKGATAVTSWLSLDVAVLFDPFLVVTDSYAAGTVVVVVVVVVEVVVVVVVTGCAVSITLPTLAWPHALFVPTSTS
jgi:hypothetical protein